MPDPRPPRWWTELSLIVVVYAAYSGARLLARGDVATAVDNGLAILEWERGLLLNAEEPLNRLFTDVALLGVPSSFLYASLHYLVTPAILVWLFRRQPVRYRLMRTWLAVSTLLGLVGFTLLPTAPPRLLDDSVGFTDTLEQYSDWGWWSDAASAPSGLGDLTNQYAAMPSLHVGWAFWCGVALWVCARRTLATRALAVGYPLLTCVVVMGTANHYLLDVVAGIVVMVVGLLLALPVTRLVARVRSADRQWLPGRSRGAAEQATSGRGEPATPDDGPAATGLDRWPADRPKDQPDRQPIAGVAPPRNGADRREPASVGVAARPQDD